MSEDLSNEGPAARRLIDSSDIPAPGPESGDLGLFDWSPAKGGDYPIGPDVEIVEIGYGDKADQEALRYAKGMFPHFHLRLLSSEGSGGVVLEDSFGRAWKVARSNSDYPYDEQEAASLALLSSEGLAPRPYLFIDALPEQRFNLKGRTVEPPLSSVTIPRQQGKGKLPILIMEKIDFVPAYKIDLPPEALIREFDKILEVATKYKLRFGDVELVYDKAAGHFKFLDVGGVHPYKETQKYLHPRDAPPVDRFPELTSDEYMQAAIIKDLLFQFLTQLISEQDIAEILKTRGLDGVHELLVSKAES